MYNDLKQWKHFNDSKLIKGKKCSNKVKTHIRESSRSEKSPHKTTDLSHLKIIDLSKWKEHKNKDMIKEKFF